LRRRGALFAATLSGDLQFTAILKTLNPGEQ